MSKTLYDILEISTTASPEVIKSAYRTLAAKLHPDHNSSGSDEAFKLVTRAYEILSNPAKKAEYDARLFHGEEDVFLGVAGAESRKETETVKRRDGSDTWCTIDEHVRRKGVELSMTNLEGVRLINLSLAGAILTGADLSHANIQSVNLSGSNLDRVICRNGVFEKVNFMNASFENAVFENCVFKECNFRSCLLSDVMFKASDFRGSCLANIVATNVDFSHSILESLLLSAQTSYEDFNLELNRFTNCNFQRCNLCKAIFGSHDIQVDRKESVHYTRVALRRCDFTGANLEEVSAKNSIFDKCNFTDANFASANLKGSRIVNPQSFKGASLYGTDFTNAEIENADFRTCNIVNTRFHGAKRKIVLFPHGFVPPSSETVVEQTAASGCFIVTACCGVDSDEVRDLRKYRDTVLVRHPVGRAFIRQYYRFSPPVARLLDRHPKAAKCVRHSAIGPIHKIVCRHYHKEVPSD